jgi:general secretion pathway protein A
MPYLDHFQLKDQPFRLTPDPDYVFWSEQHLKARRYLDSTVWLADGFVIITGEIGSGKTTLIQSFLSELDDKVVYALVSQTQLTATEFLEAVLTAFGFKPFGKGKVELLDMLNMFMIEQYAQGKHIALIVDEAQNLDLEVLEEIRMLSGIESNKEKILRIILAGQPELREKIESPQLEQLMQRVRLQFHLGPLKQREMREYVEHRISVAGGNPRTLFADEVYDEIYLYTGGVPRLINTLCDSALLCAFADQDRRITLQSIIDAVDELGWKRRKTGREPTAPPPPVASVDSIRPRSVTGAAPQAKVAPKISTNAIARLVVKTEYQTVGEIDLSRGRVIIGSTPDNDVQIESPLISKHHAMLLISERGSVIMDLESENGLHVGSQRVDKRNLHDGDIVALDPHGIHEVVYMSLSDEK